MTTTTTVSVQGVQTTLTFGDRYDVRWTRGGRLRHLRSVLLSSRTPNGSLRFDRGENADPVLRYTRVKPGEVESISPVIAPAPVADVAAELAKRSPENRPEPGEDVSDAPEREERAARALRAHAPGSCWCGEEHDDEPSDGTLAAYVGRSRGSDLSPEEEARRAANRAREMSRNVQWTCAVCHRRTRQPECSNGHPAVAAPAGKRRGAK